ncbi:hypothetical protein Pmani_034115 [Petrolisthes manimaculis]|uniref:USP domain-containing protein n=1 Tax=Petrolisthes manimaculis TaxID=1843537 RepID=A0AAE1NPB5_9EUCA|nr:hypothetical protein Pmani_034115 [Petrolisthes manimaculis]
MLKVDTVKRICLKKLPPIMAIQLKRFDYDWERECSIKFNDYFEFPRELDMDPYTVAGLARNGELIDYDPEDMKTVVWYKFDDGEVTECKMDDEDEMKNQCFGGEYMGEQVFDNIMKRFLKKLIMTNHPFVLQPPQDRVAESEEIAMISTQLCRLDQSGGGCTLSDQLLLLNKEVSEHGRHLTQYFHLFHLYASLGLPEKLQLLKNTAPLANPDGDTFCPEPLMPI